MSLWFYDHDTGTIETADRLVIAYNRYQRTDKQTQVNGRLIAAAPELLETLHQIAACESHSPGDVVDIARKAIAKVESAP